MGEDEGKIVKMFSDSVNINYLSEIRQRLTNIQSYLAGDIKNEFAKMILPEVLGSFVKRLQSTGSSQHLFQYELSVWHREKKNFASAYIVFVESIITFVCEKMNRTWYEKFNRDKAKDEIMQNNIFELKRLFDEANTPRKNIAHNLSKKIHMENDIRSLERLQKEFIKIVRKNN
jgi:hypothetical protein